MLRVDDEGALELACQGIKKCEALPVADFDTSSSEACLRIQGAGRLLSVHQRRVHSPSLVKDPYLRCTWDNMVMLSPVVKQSLRPVFNQSFYFPVRASRLHTFCRRHSKGRTGRDQQVAIRGGVS